MGLVFDFTESKAYEKWAHQFKSRLDTELEFNLMRQLLKPATGESVIDIGCGIGHSLMHLLNAGLQVTGLDPSPYMLDISQSVVGNRVDLYRGFAEDLPFDDNSFNHASIFTTLEFVDNPRKALAEAFRVAKDRVFLGVLNRYAIQGANRRATSPSIEAVYEKARFFSIWELKGLIRDLGGAMPVRWRTICQFPNTSGKFASSFERSRIVQRCPFGSFAGMVITLVPRVRTRPLALRYSPKQSPGELYG
ncbi:MAG: class I SAM-dependent methyltransferase [Desulfobacteraceae bacterium]|nr:class I SAM-dependent methyltransferase [Desulfobacteraceae bacterium]